MDDLISRQAAIDAIERTDWYHINNKGELVHGANSKDDVPLYKAEDIYKAVNDLPSAKQWIPCSEKMPQTNISILYCTTTGTVGEGRYEGYNGIHEVWKMYAICGTHWDDEVTAWMSLPEPYKGEET